MIRVLGVMTGTSCDGLDAACLEFTPSGWKALWSAERQYPRPLRNAILAMQRPRSRHSLEDMLLVDRKLGAWYGSSLTSILRTRSASQRPQIIANHGQTVAHFPSVRGRPGLTLQLGDPTWIARTTGLTVVCGFREGDQAAGGQGAPLVPRFHAELARTRGLPWPGTSVHNLGGISNLTYLGRRGEIIAFDTGPGNLWIDDAMRRATRGRKHLDLDGNVARAAWHERDQEAVVRASKLPYFRKAPPKSTGRDDFPFELLLSLTHARGAPLVATATEVTASSIAQAYRRWILDRGLPLEQIVLCGGGARNAFLLQRIANLLPSAKVRTSESLGVSTQSVEAQAFALLGYRALLGLPLGGIWTGARSFGPPAKLVPGANWAQVMSRLRPHLAAQAKRTQSPP